MGQVGKNERGSVDMLSKMTERHSGKNALSQR